MNIQIFGRSKCFDTKKAERFFKERRIKYQYIDLDRYGMSLGELKSVLASVGGLDGLLDQKNPDSGAVKYLSPEEARLGALLDDPKLIRTPVVRNGRKATVGYAPEVWEKFE
ncbi:MAG: ArsC family transcriptional regulator [Clostridia bacterium]|nr:ArsC family transcriptional regulator [Clostridia bacterium]